MKQRTYIFIHQNMPAQFLHMVLHLRDEGHRIYFITKNKPNRLANVTKVLYEVSREASPKTHHYLHAAENGILHGQAVYRALDNLKRNGVQPDMIVGHAGWGETLLVKDIFRACRCSAISSSIIARRGRTSISIPNIRRPSTH